MKLLIKSILPLLFAILFLSGCSSDKRTFVTIETNHGNMVAVLYDETPKHRDNFKKLVEEGFYDGLLFHRCIGNFMIQGGDPDSRDAEAGARLGSGGPGYLIDHEIGAPHIRGTLSAARTGGGANPDKKSSGSQFFVVQGLVQTPEQLDQWQKRKGFVYNEMQRELYTTEGGRPELDGDYTVFGELISGLEVVDKINSLPTDRGNRPLEDVVMKIRLGKR